MSALYVPSKTPILSELMLAQTGDTVTVSTIIVEITMLKSWINVVVYEFIIHLLKVLGCALSSTIPNSL